MKKEKEITPEMMKERDFADQVAMVMRRKGAKQTEFAKHRGITRQAVNRAFAGKGGLLTGTARAILEWLDLDIKLIPKKEA